MISEDQRRGSFPPSDHDHRHCISEALNRAEQLCRLRGARLTALRRRVLELIWSSHAPVGAYDLLRRLSREHESAAPPTVYRALEFLQTHGLIHRIESLNAFVGCAEPAEHHAGQFLICNDCGATAELQDPGINTAIARGAAELGFAIESRMIELHGLCPICQRPEQAAQSNG